MPPGYAVAAYRLALQAVRQWIVVAAHSTAVLEEVLPQPQGQQQETIQSRWPSASASVPTSVPHQSAVTCVAYPVEKHPMIEIVLLASMGDHLAVELDQGTEVEPARELQASTRVQSV